MKFQLILALALTIFHGPYAASHHSMVAFDPSKRVNVAGVVTKLEWSNPHVRLYVKEQGDEAGVATEWEFELPSVNHLIRRGWSRHAIKVGDRVVVMAARARAFPNVAYALTVTDSNGRRLFAGTASETR